MEMFLSIVQTLSLAGAAAGLLLIAFQFRQVARNSLPLTVTLLSVLSTSRSPVEPKWGYTIFMWTKGQWVLESDLSAPGCSTTPPKMPGSYEGQLVRKDAEPQ